MCGVKLAGEGVFGLLGGGELKTTRSGIGGWGSLLGRSLLGVYGGHNCFGSTYVGVLIRMEDMSSPRSETEWVALFHGTFVHTTSPSVGIGPGRVWQVR